MDLWVEGMVFGQCWNFRFLSESPMFRAKLIVDLTGDHDSESCNYFGHFGGSAYPGRTAFDPIMFLYDLDDVGTDCSMPKKSI